jgi:predicted TIM-barrel enzyme
MDTLRRFGLRLVQLENKKDTPYVTLSINQPISGYLLRIIEKIRAAVEIKLQQDWLSALMADVIQVTPRNIQ